MEKADIEELRGRVGCAAVLETGGFAIDLKESTRKAVKYRRGDDIIIVIHDGKGWFDPLSDAKGDVYSLVQHLDGGDFLEAFVQVASLVSFEPREPEWKRLTNPYRIVGVPGASPGAGRQPGDICATTGTFPNRSSGQPSPRTFCGKGRVGACGPLIRVPMAWSPVGRNVVPNGAALQPAAARSCSASGSRAPLASA